MTYIQRTREVANLFGKKEKLVYTSDNRRMTDDYSSFEEIIDAGVDPMKLWHDNKMVPRSGGF